MLVGKEEINEVGQVKKEVIGHCEICKQPFDKECLKHKALDNGDYINAYRILICCPDCYRRFTEAEFRYQQRLDELTKETREKLGMRVSNPNRMRQPSPSVDNATQVKILGEYQEKRTEIIAEAIVETVGTHKTDKKPTIGAFFGNLNADIYLRNLCREAGVWDALAYQIRVKEKIEKLREEEKAKKKHHKK